MSSAVVVQGPHSGETHLLRFAGGRCGRLEWGR